MNETKKGILYKNTVVFMMSSSKSTVCLNMIVRNEAKIIRRLLDSVQFLVKEYVIVDTGSTDDTVAQIEAYPLPGVVIHEPFVNFGVSRTFALEQARLHSQCDYLLLLDADMELRVFGTLPTLTASAYYVTQISGLTYRNIRFIQRNLPAKCVGSTHEYYDLPPGSVVEALDADIVVILDRGDGGCKANKFERDRRLLQEELQRDPENPRTVFYLAQTYFDMRRYDEAIPLYQKRIELGGWKQEMFYSALKITMAYIALNDLGQARMWTERANDMEKRAEPSYYLCKALRETGANNELAYYFLLKAASVPRPSPENSLFIEDAVYDYLIDFERCVLWYYVHPEPTLKTFGVTLSLQFLDKANVPENLRKCVLSNMVYYVNALSSYNSPKRLFTSEFWEKEWRYSSAQWLNDDDDSPMLTRLVNYAYTEDGKIVFTEEPVRTKLLVGSSQIIDQVHNATQWHNPESHIKDLEDTRIVHRTKNAYNEYSLAYTLSASMEYSRGPGIISQVVGRLDVDKGIHTVIAVLASPEDRSCEKNWVVAGDLDHVIYEWYPEIRIGRVDLDNETYVFEQHIPSPRSFLGMRGSTNGVFYDGLYWFVTHVVVGDRGIARVYLHRLVALDPKLTKIVHASDPFVFEPGGDVEYCLGFRISSQGIVTFAYSVRDRFPCTLEISIFNLISF